MSEFRVLNCLHRGYVEGVLHSRTKRPLDSISEVRSAVGIGLFTLRLRCSKLCPPLFVCLRNLRSPGGRHHPFLPASRFTTATACRFATAIHAAQEFDCRSHRVQLLLRYIHLFLELRFFLPQRRQDIHESSLPDILSRQFSTSLMVFSILSGSRR